MIHSELISWIQINIKANPDWLKESVFKKKHGDGYEAIKTYSGQNNLTSLAFKEQAWCFVNRLQQKPSCLTCGSFDNKFINFFQGYGSYCSRRCSAQNEKTKLQREETCLKEYGVRTIKHHKPSEEKRLATLKENYDVTVPAKSKIVREKTKQTNIEKYGVDNPRKAESVKTKIKNTVKANQNIETEYFVQSKKFKEKKAKTVKEKYDDVEFTSQHPIVKEKIKQTNIKVRGVDNPFKCKKVQKKIRSTFLDREEHFVDIDSFEHKISKTSKTEQKVREALNGTKFLHENKEFDIKVDNHLIEVDGDYFHPSKLENLTITQVNNLINDKAKIDLAKRSEFELHKIHVSNIPKQITLESIIANSYIPDYSLSYTQKIIDKKYFKKYIEEKGKQRLQRYVPMLLKFVRTFCPNFPIVTTNENIQDITTYVKNYSLDKVYNKETKTFDNAGSNSGMTFLKSLFSNYWSSSYLHHLSPKEVWNNDDLMYKIIKYRIGINDSNEVFDFNLQQLIRGISTNRYTISFFKPITAAAIYKQLLGEIDNPIVIDPCAGFGGRMLGFKSVRPNGTYIGIEPNKETYNHLQTLAKNFTNVVLYNEPFEKLDLTNENYDLIFTSIPYYNLETYSGLDLKYNSFEKWNSSFISTFNKYENVFINLPEKLCRELELEYNDCYYLQNKADHFSKELTKRELIIKLKNL